MTTLSNNYYGTSGQLGAYYGGNGGNGSYALNIGGPKTGGGHYLPPGVYTTGASVEIRGGSGGEGYYGGRGGSGGSGGAGVVLSSGTLTNGGSINGGLGGNGVYGYSSSGNGGGGGVGVALSSGTLTNTGSINGGVGGYGGYGGQFAFLGGGGGGGGGAGVTVSSGTLTNFGSINGGAGGVGGYGGYIARNGGSGGVGGVGVILSSGTLTNQGITTGGAGGNGGPANIAASGAGGAGGAGIYMQGGALTNSNAIIGGSGGTSGGPGTEYNVGCGAGGAGVTLSSGTLTNDGSITGGAGGVGINGGPYGVGGGGGGAGLTLSSGTSINDGHITGGAGGNGAYGYFSGGSGGAGGAGVTLSSGTLTNGGSITGSAGGNGGQGANFPPYSIYGIGGAGGAGGAGASLNGGTLMTSGTISGGAGGAGGIGSNHGSGGAGGNGGAGVYLNGGTLTTSGTISGGAGGAGGPGAPNGAAGAAGDAVQFGAVASTLIVNPGAVFNGQVAANASVNDVLKLRGTEAAGTPITLGTQFTGFSTLTFASGASWIVDAGSGATSNSGLTVNAFKASDTIDVTNLGPTQVAADFNSTTHVLTLPGDGTFDFSGSFSGESFVFASDNSSGTDITVMKGSVISQTVSATVTAGSLAYPSPLTITSTGKVAPGGAMATGVVSSISDNSVTNEGAIQGGAGALNSSGVGGVGGMGVNLKAGTLTNTGSISGGAGGNGSTKGGHGGAGVELNGGTLITSGTISGGVGGAGPPVGGSGDAVQFGTAASTLIVDPGAVFNGQVVGNASVHDVLELSGTQTGGTAITLGTQFTNFSMLEFAPGATGTVDATVADLTSHPLSVQGSIAGFGLGDTLDITNLVHAGTTYSFDASTEILSITKGATTIQLGFDSPFTGDHFVLASNGHGGTDITLQTGAASEPASLHGFSSQGFVNHDFAHDAHVMMS
jgi:hypothetical protein